MTENRSAEFRFSPSEIKEILKERLVEKIAAIGSPGRRYTISIDFDLAPVEYDGPGCPTYIVKEVILKAKSE